MRWQHQMTLALVAAATAMTAGCAQINVGNEGTAGGRLRAVRHAHIVDVPTPEGFTIEDKLSEDYATPGWRFVRHAFVGPSDRRAVLNFYREQMPLADWTYISRQSRDGRYTLRFEKPNEVCEVVIEPTTGRFGGSGTRIQIEVKPLRRSGKIKGEEIIP